MNTSEFKLNLAVVIGINDYRNGIPTLGTAKQDAEAIATILQTNYQYQVNLITDNQATTHNLRQWLETELPEVIKKKTPSRLLFYFAGHGIALNGDDGPQGYLIPQDAKLGDVSTYIPMQQVEAALTQLSCRHCLVILDCCFAGAFRWSSTRKLIPITETIHKERYDRFIQDPAWQVITSAASDQSALDNLDLKGDRGIAKNNTNHSPFAAALIEALSGSADAYPPANNGKPAGDGVITATELYLYLRDSVEIPTDVKHQRQTPQIWCLKKHDKGEFIFLPPGHELNLPPAPSLDELEDNNPYQGLKSYETKDSALFFGRTALIEKLCDAMSDRPFMVVLGASGSGKSSLVKAGLIAHLDGSAQAQQSRNQRLKPQEHPHQCKYWAWKILTPIRPGESPLNSLNSALKELAASSTPSETDRIDAKTLREAIVVWCQANPGIKLLLTIDQFEELITICLKEQERQQFLDLLAELLNAYPDVLRLLVTLRSDFEPQFRNTALEKDWLAARFVVPAMTREELRAVIEEPASTKVVYFESLDNRGYLVDQLIDEVAGMPGALPLLSFALSELYLKLARRYLEAQNTGDLVERVITWADYDELGGVTKSLTRRADEEYDALVKADPAYELTIRHVILRMVTVGNELARRQVPESELKYPEQENTRVQTVIGHFSAARLLVNGTDADDKPYIEPAHDALVRGWEKLLTWKKEEEENLILQRRLTPAAAEWNNIKNKEKEQPKGILDRADPILDWLDRGLFTVENLFNKIPVQFARLLWQSQNQQARTKEKPEQFLWDANPYLDVLDKEFNSKDNWLNKVEAEFVQQSVLQKRRNISWRWRIAIWVILGLSGLTIAALIQWRNSELNQAKSLGRYSSFLLSERNWLDALVEAIKAEKILQNQHATDPVVRLALEQAVYERSERNRLEGHTGSVRSVSLSPDGQTIATASEDYTVRLWSTGGKELHKFTVQNQVFRNVTFNTDGTMVAAISADNTIKVWGIDGQEVGTVKGQDDEENFMSGICFVPKTNIIAASGSANTVKLWRINGQKLQLIRTLNGHKYPVWSIGCSKDGKIVTADQGGFLALWSKDGKELKKPFIGKESIFGVSFSPDGQTFATAGGDTTVRLWNLDGKELKTLGRHNNFVTSVSFSQDGKTIASTSADKTVKLWSLDGKELKTLNGHDVSVDSASFSPDGKMLASASDDNTVKLWSIGDSESKTFFGHQDSLYSVSFSPDGKTIASAGDGESKKKNDTIKLWSVDGQELNSFPANSNSEWNRIWSLSFSPDGQTIATANSDETIVLWSLKGQKLRTFTGHNAEVVNVKFGPKDSILASASYDGTVKLWNMDGKCIKTFNRKAGKVRSVSFSPDGKIIASAYNDGTIKLWNLVEKEEQEPRTFVGYSAYVTDVSFSPDGRIIASASKDKVIKLWSLDGQELRTLQGHTGEVARLSFSPDSKTLASASTDGTIRLWDLANGQEIKTLKGRDLPFYNVSFSPDGKKVVSVSDDARVELWNAETQDSQQLMLQGCKWLHDYLMNKPRTDKHLCEGIQ